MFKKIILYTIGILFSLLIIAAITLSSIDLKDHCHKFFDQKLKQSGKEFDCKSIKLSLLPTIRLIATDAKLKDINSNKDIFNSNFVEVCISLKAALNKKIALEELKIIDLNLLIEKTEDNNTSNVGKIDTLSHNSSNANGYAKQISGFLTLCKKIYIYNASIKIHDKQNKSDTTFSNVDVLLEKKQDNKIDVNANVTFDDYTLSLVKILDVTGDKINTTGKLSLKQNNNCIQADLNGSIDLFNDQYFAQINFINTQNNLFDIKNISGTIFINTKDKAINIKSDDLNIDNLILKLNAKYLDSLSTNIKTSYKKSIIDLNVNSKNFKEYDVKANLKNLNDIFKLFEIKQKAPDMNLNGKVFVKGEIIHLIDFEADLFKLRSELNFKTKKYQMLLHTKNLKQLLSSFDLACPYDSKAKIHLLFHEDHINCNLNMHDGGSVEVNGDIGKEKQFNIKANDLKFLDYKMDAIAVLKESNNISNIDFSNISLKGKNTKNTLKANVVIDGSNVKNKKISGKILDAKNDVVFAIEPNNASKTAANNNNLANDISSNETYSKEKIEFDFKGMHLNFAIDLSNINLFGNNINNLKTNISIKDNLCKIPFSFFISKGSVNGEITISNDKNVKINISSKNINPNDIKALKEHFKDGSIKTTINLNTKINSIFDFVSNLSGNANITIDNSTINGFDLKKATQKMKKIKNINDIMEISSAFDSGSTNCKLIKANFDIKNAKCNSTDMLVDANDAVINGNGEIDVLNRNVNFKLKIVLENFKKMPLKVKVKGNFDKLKYSLDTKDMLNIGGNLIGNLFKTDEHSSTDNPVNTVQKAVKKIKVDKLLKSIFG